MAQPPGFGRSETYFRQVPRGNANSVLRTYKGIVIVMRKNQYMLFSDSLGYLDTKSEARANPK